MKFPKFKAKAILDEENERRKKIEEHETIKLQVIMRDVFVGWAYIRPDGTFEAELHSSLMGNELRELLVGDLFTHLSIGPKKPEPKKSEGVLPLVSQDANRTKLKRKSE